MKGDQTVGIKIQLKIKLHKEIQRWNLNNYKFMEIIFKNTDQKLVIIVMIRKYIMLKYQFTIYK